MLVGVCGAAVLADEPPSWEPFEQCSASGRYCAAIEPSIESAPPWDAEYELTIWDNLGKKLRRQLWTSSFDYDGYSGGLVTPNGDAFVRVSHWYYIDTVVSIYRRDRRLDIVGRAFKIPVNSLQKTASHHLWLTDVRTAFGLAAEDILFIRTIDGKQHWIDLVTGVFVEQPTND